jgi:diguanylate cyclase (GGDEF)-like protein/PAS domain S-box-containing protein
MRGDPDPAPAPIPDPGEIETSGLVRFGRFRLDRATGSAAWSEEIRALYGLAAEDEAPSLHAALAAFPEAAQAELRAGIARSWETGEAVSVAAAITRRDGSRREVLVRLRADPAPEGGPRRTLSGIMLDVSDARAFDARLAQERALLRTTLDHMDQGVLVVAPDMSVPVLSPRVTELLRLPEAFADRPPSFPEIIAYQYESGAISLETLNSSINTYILNLEDLPEVHVYERETFDGRTLEVRTTKLPSGGFVRTFTDQTARRRREAETASAQADYQRLFRNALVGVYRADAEGRFLRANPALGRMMGYATGEDFVAAIGDPAVEFMVDYDRGMEFLRRLREEGRVADFVSEVYRHRTGERIWVAETAWAIRDGPGAMLGFEGTIVEATERKRAEERIAHLARHDPLTGLANRQRFVEALGAALAAGERLAVLFLDLDRFKAVNDTLGHPAGDALLRAVAERLTALAGPEDVVARFGGDEFAILRRDAGAAEAAAFAEGALAALDAPIRIEGREIGLGAGLGVALAPQDAADPAALMQAADIALYRAKGQGRFAWRAFTPEMAAEVEARRRLELDLRAALGGAAFGLAYEPIVALATGRPVGHEALLRWRHPERGEIPAVEVIAVAEETRLIGEIGAWALARACAEAAAWPGAQGLWVNVSPLQIADPGFEATLDAALEASGFPAARLLIEITETALLGRQAELAARLERVRARGVRTVLDDFGTGYSSLGYLRRLPFDVIKIDQSFVQDLARPETAAVVMSVLDLARRLGIATVAEGVETEAQLAALRVAGCAFVQGRLFGAAVTAAEAARAG